MNRTRLLVLGSVLTLVGLGLAATSASAQVASPAPGYYQPGYYPTPAPGDSGGYYASPAPTAYYGGYYGYNYRAPMRGGYSTPGRSYSGQGRSLQMPWLQPLRGSGSR